MSDAPVVVVGDLVADVLVELSGPPAPGSDTPVRVRHRAGGAGGNVASWLAHLGVPVVLATRVGDDVIGRSLVAELAAAGVESAVTVDPDAATGTVVVLIDADGERTMLPDRGANRALTAADVPDRLLTQAGHLHLSAYPLLDPESRDAALDLVTRTRRRRLSMSVDPASVAPLSAYGVPEFLHDTAGADLLLPNGPEARLLAGTDDLAAATRRLTRHYAAVIATDGAAGAHWSAGAESATVPAGPAAVVDTTGAGDAFTAGVLAARRTGGGPADWARRGCAVAALAVATVGARPPRRAAVVPGPTLRP